MSTLPLGWAPAVVGDVLESWDRLREPLNAEQRASRKGPYPYFGANGQVDSIDEFRYEGDFVLVAEDGGYFDQPLRGVAYAVSGKFWVNNHAHVLRPRGDLPIRYFLHALNAIDWMPHVGGSTRLKLTAGSLERVALVLPPLNEQRRIVAKLDAIFEQTRAAKARLQRLPALLEKLKRSVLAAAFRGDLTKDWRAAHPDVEPATVLLDRIRVERRRRWQDGVRAKAKDPSKATYGEPAAVEVGELPELPPGWAWTSLASLAWDASYGTSVKCDYDGVGEFVLRIPNVARGVIDVDDLKRALQPLQLDVQELLASGDFLVVRTNGSRDLIGRAACVLDDGAAIGSYFASYLIRFRIIEPAVGPWLSLWWRSPYMRGWLEEHAASSAGQYNVSMSTLAAAPIPLAGAGEIARITAIVQQCLEKTSAEVSRFDNAHRAVVRLEQAALAKAFRGELVPQDPTDEPASVLLQRISAARAAEPKPSRGGRAKRASTGSAGNSLSTSPGNGDASTAQHLDLVVAAFQQAPRLTAADIGEATGLDASTVKQALADLVDGGVVRVEGKSRATSYVWTA